VSSFLSRHHLVLLSGEHVSEEKKISTLILLQNRGLVWGATDIGLPWWWDIGWVYELYSGQ